jgi:uncharacterized delta-60 repeat protein
MKKRYKNSLLISIFLLCQNLAISQPGSLDLSFGTGGIVTTDINLESNVGYAMAIQSDGKIIVGGYAVNSVGLDFDFALARYNTDGSLDNTFNASGKVTTDFVGENDWVYAVKIQADGKIVVAGFSLMPSGDIDFALARYNSNGSLDNTFSGDGKQTTQITTGTDIIYGLAIQPDGKIVAAGKSYLAGSVSEFAVVRYTTSGNPDVTFDIDGIVTTTIGTNNGQANALGIQLDGKIVVAGTTVVGTQADYAIARYNTNGILDGTFDGDGMVTIDINTSNDYGNSLQLQTDGKIIVGGYSFNTSDRDFSLVRCNVDGSLDFTFDLDGKVITNFSGVNDEGWALAIQADGKIILGGNNGNFPNYDFALARYNTNGSLDNSFDGDGKVNTSIGSPSDWGQALAIQSDGKIVMAGYINTGSNSDFALARYNDAAIGISESTDSQNRVIIYPNPVTWQLNAHIQIGIVNSNICIFNSSGQLLFFRENCYGSDFIFDVSNFSTGIYFLEIDTQGECTRTKFLKE